MKNSFKIIFAIIWSLFLRIPQALLSLAGIPCGFAYDVLWGLHGRLRAYRYRLYQDHIRPWIYEKKE